MIEKMAYVNIAGPKERLDGITEKYLCEYDIDLENAVLRFDGQDFAKPMVDANPYKELLGKSEQIQNEIKRINAKDGKGQDEKFKKKQLTRLEKKFKDTPCMNISTAKKLVEDTYDRLEELLGELSEINSEREKLQRKADQIKPFEGFDMPLESVKNFEYVICKFGRVRKDAWNEFKKELDNDDTTIFTKCSADSDYVWGVFFVPKDDEARANSFYAALRFEQVHIDTDLKGTPEEISAHVKEQLDTLSEREKRAQSQLDLLLGDEKKDELWFAGETVKAIYHNCDAHKMAACIKDQRESGGVDAPFFFLCGWMRREDAADLGRKLEKEEKDIIFVDDEDLDDISLTPPTSIKNAAVFRPYEMYTRMYGLPNYKEFDPTVIIALLYSFMFGAMFGDLGHGLCLFVGGLVIYLTKHKQIAGIIASAGLFSAVFGLLYGSFFGFEDIIPTLWMKPREAMSELNFIGRINTVFAIAVLFGMLLMLALMVINVLSHIKQKDFIDSIFTSNGIAGFLFYGTVVLVAVLYVTGKQIPANVLVIAIIIVSVLAMALNEPITNAIRKKKAFESGVGMFCVEAFFDLFETMLTYFSNTLSFLRVGAFAISHAAMMEVVLSLGGYTNGGSGNVIVLILGNIFVMGFEGLIVGIQVLRLQYYEVFSKFYRGDGREFKPFFKKRRSN